MSDDPRTPPHMKILSSSIMTRQELSSSSGISGKDPKVSPFLVVSTVDSVNEESPLQQLRPPAITRPQDSELPYPGPLLKPVM